MNKDDIVIMARVAGVRDDGHRFEFSEYKYLERFADLVAAHERKAYAKWLDFYDGPNGRRAEAIRARGNT